MAKIKDPLFGEVPKVSEGRENESPSSQLPDTLKGKTPEEIYVMMNEEHNRVVNETVSNLTQQFSQRNQPAPPAQPIPPRFVPPQEQRPKEEEAPDFDVDRDGFMDYQFKQRLGPIVQQQVIVARGQNRNLFRQRLGDDEWKKYEPEIEQLMDGLHPQIQMHPDIYQRAYDMVRSSHHEEIVEEESNRRTLGTVTKVLASLGNTPEQITEILKSVAEGTPLATLAQRSVEASQQAVRKSLFQQNTGVKPMVDPLKSSVQAVYPQNTSRSDKRKRSEDELGVMEAFGMTEKEYDEYAKENTDLVSMINRGEV